MTQTNNTFKIGENYKMTFITDADLKPEYKCINRTRYTATFEKVSAIKEKFTRKIRSNQNVGADASEYILVGNYSMAPSINSKNVVIDIFQSYTPKENESLVLIENFDGYSYKVYAVYVDGVYDRRIKVAKF